MVSKNKKRLMPMVVPMLQERQRMMDTHGDEWEDKPVRHRLRVLLNTLRNRSSYPSWSGGSVICSSGCWRRRVRRARRSTTSSRRSSSSTLARSTRRAGCVLSPSRHTKEAHRAPAGIYACVVQRCGVSAVRPAASGGDRGHRRAGRVEQSLAGQDAQAGQLLQGDDASRRRLPPCVPLLRLSVPSFLQLTSRPQWVSSARR